MNLHTVRKYGYRNLYINVNEWWRQNTFYRRVKDQNLHFLSVVCFWDSGFLRCQVPENPSFVVSTLDLGVDRLNPQVYPLEMKSDEGTPFSRKARYCCTSQQKNRTPNRKGFLISTKISTESQGISKKIFRHD